MATELAKAAVSVSVITDDEGFIDGLEINGRLEHRGGAQFSGHGDHRILMAMMLFSLACQEPCTFDGDTDTSDSYPGFVDQLAHPADWQPRCPGGLVAGWPGGLVTGSPGPC
jgi:3-phosphoshikimate 1-carboxyvinyltransferase